MIRYCNCGPIYYEEELENQFYCHFTEACGASVEKESQSFLPPSPPPPAVAMMEACNFVAALARTAKSQYEIKPWISSAYGNPSNELNHQSCEGQKTAKMVKRITKTWLLLLLLCRKTDGETINIA